MGILKHGILGLISGKVGDAVYSSYRGVQIKKSLPKKSEKAPTPGQLEIQARFSLITKFIGRTKELIDIGYRPRSSKEKRAREKAFKYHYDHAVAGEYPNYRLDYQRIRLSNPSGDQIAGIYNREFKAVPGRRAELTWDMPPRYYGHSCDRDLLCVLLYHVQKNEFIPLLSAAFRADGKRQFNFSMFSPGDVIHGWVFFVSPESKNVSQTTYLGLIVLNNFFNTDQCLPIFCRGAL